MPHQLVLLAQSEPTAKRMVGLHGDDFTHYALALAGLFLLGLLILGVVVASGRRPRRRERDDSDHRN